MIKFEKTQKILDIGGVKVGGQPGELPTVLIGSIFHEGHKIVYDRRKGIFDKRNAERLIRVQEEMSSWTGNPHMLDVVGETVEALTKYIEFVSEVAESPFLINGPSAEVRIAAARYAVEVGLKDRAIYNSVNYTLGEWEINAIRETGLKTALFQAFNPRDPRPRGMVAILKRLRRENERLGIENVLTLTPVLDVPSIGFGAYGVYLVKEEFGLPTGTVPVGVVGRWRRIKEFGRDAKRICRAGALALAQAMGANFIIYGSIAKARDIFPVCAMIDATIAYNARNMGIKPLTKNHPLYKIL